jgi:hypothetical protein
MKKKNPEADAIKELIKELCGRESGKAQVNVAQMTEIVHHLGRIVFVNPIFIAALLVSGARDLAE